jgi:hypothetical protein
MKRTLVIGVLVVLALTVALAAGTAVLAKGPSSGDNDGVRNYDGTGINVGSGPAYGFVDENGDGVNDRFVDADGDGICDQFVDADGDGVCDNCGQQASYGPGHQAGPQGQSYGSASQTQTQGGHRYQGANCVDLNGDGVCDCQQ